MSDCSFRPPLTTHAILAAIFPQWRDRDERLCREIVARGICAPTEDLGIAVRATLAHVDSLRVQRDDMARRWDDVWEARAGMLAQFRDACAHAWRRHDELVSERDAARAELAALRASIKDIAGRMGGSNG